MRARCPDGHVTRSSATRRARSSTATRKGKARKIGRPPPAEPPAPAADALAPVGVVAGARDPFASADGFQLGAGFAAGAGSGLCPPRAFAAATSGVSAQAAAVSLPATRGAPADRDRPAIARAVESRRIRRQLHAAEVGHGHERRIRSCRCRGDVLRGVDRKGAVADRDLRLPVADRDGRGQHDLRPVRRREGDAQADTGQYHSRQRRRHRDGWERDRREPRDRDSRQRRKLHARKRDRGDHQTEACRDVRLAHRPVVTRARDTNRDVCVDLLILVRSFSSILLGITAAVPDPRPRSRTRYCIGLGRWYRRNRWRREAIPLPVPVRGRCRRGLRGGRRGRRSGRSARGRRRGCRRRALLAGRAGRSGRGCVELGDCAVVACAVDPNADIDVERRWRRCCRRRGGRRRRRLGGARRVDRGGRELGAIGGGITVARRGIDLGWRLRRCILVAACVVVRTCVHGARHVPCVRRDAVRPGLLLRVAGVCGLRCLLERGRRGLDRVRHDRRGGLTEPWHRSDLCRERARGRRRVVVGARRRGKRRCADPRDGHREHQPTGPRLAQQSHPDISMRLCCEFHS